MTEQSDASELNKALFPDLVGTKLLIIGAGSTGQAVAKLAYPLGVKVAAANRTPSKLDPLKKIIPDLVTHQVNARDSASINSLLDAEKPEHIVLATGYPKHFMCGETEVSEIMDYLGDRLEPILAIANWIAKSDNKPRSFTIVSGYVRLPVVGNLAFAVLGQGLTGLAEHLAVELAPTRVNISAPGPMVDTDMARAAVGGDAMLDKLTSALETQIPIRKAVRVDDCARQIIHTMGDGITTGDNRFAEGGLSLAPGTIIQDIFADDCGH